jgi:Helix-turn-helix domain
MHESAHDATMSHERPACGMRVTVRATEGPLLRVARRTAGVPLRALAIEAGINRDELSRFERGHVPVSLNLYSHAVVTLAGMMFPKAAKA